jgi:glycosyltransferase involved in cell wall biosynthesis
LSDRIKLLFVIDSYKNPYAGTEGQLLKLLNGLDRERYEPELAVFHNSEYLASNTFPVPVVILDVVRIAAPGSWLQLYRFFKQKKLQGFRMAHIFFNDASIICPPILKLLGYRIIISRRDMGYWQTRANLVPLRLNSCIVDCVIANSKAVQQITCRKEGYPEHKVAVVYNGYKEDTSSKLPHKSESPKTGALRMVLVANIRPLKRIQDAIEAISRIRGECPGCSLTIVGAGDRSGLEELCRERGVTASVHFHGPSSEVAGLLPDFDVGLLCSESEGFSNTIIEYLQADMPVICSHVGGNPEIVDHGVNGLLYPAGDVDALSKHMLSLAKDPQRRVAMGLAGSAKVTTEYGLSKLVSAHQTIYETLAAGRRLAL